MSDDTSKRRLLVITYHFPPDGAVGGLRWAGLSKYLSRLGWEVHIVTPSALLGQEPEVEGVHRHFSPRRRTLSDVYNAGARKVRSRAASNPRPTVIPQPQPRVVSEVARPSSARFAFAMFARTSYEIRLAFATAVGFPDLSRGWILRAGFAANNLLRQNRFDAVVSSGPPHAPHFSGRIATLFRDVPLFVDLRDPLNQKERWASPGITSRFTKLFMRGMLRWLFAGVDTVIANTSEHAEEWRRAQNRVGVVHVRNGIDLELLPARTSERLDGFSIAYVGTLYMDRSFSTVLGGLRSLLEARPDVAAKVTLHIAGHMDAPNLARFQSQLVAEGLSDMVRIYGPLPRADALELLARANLALVLAQKQPTQIPAKIYECVGLGVPTLVITESNSAAANEARRIGAMTLDSDDPAGMRVILDDIVDGRFPASIVPNAPISYESLAIQMDQVLRGA